MTARERAVWMRPAELSSMVLAEMTIGSMALRPCTGRQQAGEVRDCAWEVAPSPMDLTLEQPFEAQGLLPPPHHTPPVHDPQAWERHSSSPPHSRPCYSQAPSSLSQQHPTSGLIWAGTVANSGLEAKAVRLSTASMRGAVAARHRSRFSSLKSPSRAWCGETRTVTQPPTCPKSHHYHIASERTPHLDGLHQVGCAVGHLLGRLDELALGHRVGGAGGCQTARVAQG